MRSDALHRFTPSRADRSVPGATCAHRVLRRDPAAEVRSCERPVRLLSFDPRCASRYEPSRHELALVSSGRGPYMESGFAREPALAAPPIASLSRRGSSTALSIRCHPSRAQPRLDRAHAPRGTRAAAIPVRSTDICNPQDLFSTTSPTVSVCSESCCPRDSGAAGSTPVARFGDPCAAFQQLCVPRHLLRVTPHGVPLTSLALSPRAIGTSPALAYSESSEPSFVAPRERSRRGIRLRTPFLLSCLPPRPTNRPKRVALRSVQPMIARATQKSFCNVSPTRRHFSAPQAPASHESGSAQPKPWMSPPLRSTREENRRRHPRAGEVRSRGARVVLLLGARSPAPLDLRASTPSSSPRDLRRLGPPPRPRGRSRSSYPDQVPSFAGFRAKLSPHSSRPRLASEDDAPSNNALRRARLFPHANKGAVTGFPLLAGSDRACRLDPQRPDDLYDLKHSSTRSQIGRAHV